MRHSSCPCFRLPNLLLSNINSSYPEYLYHTLVSPLRLRIQCCNSRSVVTLLTLGGTSSHFSHPRWHVKVLVLSNPDRIKRERVHFRLFDPSNSHFRLSGIQRVDSAALPMIQVSVTDRDIGFHCDVWSPQHATGKQMVKPSFGKLHRA